MKLERLPDELRKERNVISPTGLMTLFKSPKHYYSSTILKETEPTQAMEDGRAIHSAVLEPDKFYEQYFANNKEGFLVTIDDLKTEIESRNEKPVKGNKGDLINQLLTLNPDAKIWDHYLTQMEEQKKISISPKMWETCERLRDEVMNHKWLGKALTGGMIEQPAWWDHDFGVTISMRMDFFHPEMGSAKRPVIIDLKKVRSAKPRDFERQIFFDGLYIQAAVYVDGIKKITGIEPVFAWACVEATAPYIVETYAADFGMLEAGRAVYNKMILKYLECKNNNYWPGYTDGNVTNISLPPWAFGALDEYAESEIQE